MMGLDQIEGLRRLSELIVSTDEEDVASVLIEIAALCASICNCALFTICLTNRKGPEGVLSAYAHVDFERQILASGTPNWFCGRDESFVSTITKPTALDDLHVISKIIEPQIVKQYGLSSVL